MPPKHAKQPRKASAVDSDAPYQASGYFHTDLNELCRRSGIEHPPEVLIRPKPPLAQNEGSKESKKKDDKRGKQQQEEPEQPEVDEFGDPLPKTFQIQKNRLVYFRPQIHVEMDHPEKEDTVTEIWVRGCTRFDGLLMRVFQECLPLLERLHTLSLWFVGLTDEAVRILGKCVPNCSNLKTLILDGNSTARGQHWHELLQDNDRGDPNPLLRLSLKHCAIDELGARQIGGRLGNNLRSLNTRLISLNLAGNPIEDAGALGLFDGLLMNRTLLTLNVSHCGLGDAACRRLGEILSRFVLSHEQVVARRNQRAENGMSSSTSLERDRSKSTSPVSSGRISKDRALSSRAGAGSVVGAGMKEPDKMKREKSSGKAKKDEKPEKGAKGAKKDEKPSTSLSKRAGAESAASNAQALGAASAAGAKTPVAPAKPAKAGKGKGKPSSTPEMSELFTIFPLIDEVEYADEKLYLRGNFILLSLNLSRNNITEEGVAALLSAVKHQQATTTSTKEFGTGLMRLIITHNSVAPENLTLMALNELMMPRDPFYKPGANPTPYSEHDSANATPAAAGLLGSTLGTGTGTALTAASNSSPDRRLSRDQTGRFSRD